jgi:hypothetical protein
LTCSAPPVKPAMLSLNPSFRFVPVCTMRTVSSRLSLCHCPSEKMKISNLFLSADSHT